MGKGNELNLRPRGVLPLIFCHKELTFTKNQRNKSLQKNNGKMKGLVGWG